MRPTTSTSTGRTDARTRRSRPRAPLHVLLAEVARGEDLVRDSRQLRARDLALERAAQIEVREGTVVAPQGQHRLPPAPVHVPRRLALVALRVVRGDRHEQREAARARDVRLRGERRVVGRERLTRQRLQAPARHDLRGNQLAHLLAVHTPDEEVERRAGPHQRVHLVRVDAVVGADRVAPVEAEHRLQHLGREALLRLQIGNAGPALAGQRRVREHQAREAGLILGGDARTEQPAPVLTEQGDAAQVERFDQARQPGDVLRVRVRARIRRLVRAPEADQVGHDHAEAGRLQRADHLPVQVAPGRLAVEQEQRLARAARSGVDVGHAQPGLELEVARGPGIVRDAREAGLRRSQHVLAFVGHAAMIEARSAGGASTPQQRRGGQRQEEQPQDGLWQRADLQDLDAARHGQQEDRCGLEHRERRR